MQQKQKIEWNEGHKLLAKNFQVLPTWVIHMTYMNRCTTHQSVMGMTIVKETWHYFWVLVAMINILNEFHKNSSREKEAQSILVPEKWHILLSCVMDTWSSGYDRHKLVMVLCYSSPYIHASTLHAICKQHFLRTYQRKRGLQLIWRCAKWYVQNLQPLMFV